jgi:hypothetical protein
MQMRQCARQVPRVLEFAKESTFGTWLSTSPCRNFGEEWVYQEFSLLPLKIRESLLKGLSKRTTPLNVFPLLFAADHGLRKLGVVINRGEMFRKR